MKAMISAELLRLRTVATHRWIALGLLALIAVHEPPFLNGASTSADEVVAQLRGLLPRRGGGWCCVGGGGRRWRFSLWMPTRPTSSATSSGAYGWRCLITS